MKRIFVLALLIAAFCQSIFSQSETYNVNKAFFSSEKYDEFSPVFFKNGIVFCSNRNQSLSNRSTSQNKGLFKIYFIDTLSRTDWQNAKLFSKSLTTILNDGPVTFNSSKDTIYFSRNQKISTKLSDHTNSRNKLGIYSAVLIDGKWTRIRELRINNEWYNVTTPCLSPDGKKLYFASDKPGGYGGSDLYYSIWKNDRWDDPVNLGPLINTEGNEAYPFINPAGDLFFSSDGHKGHGGKDIFFSSLSDTTWLTPVCLDPPINSRFDDFGIITDTLMNEGYFSSKRDKSVDIYNFRTNFTQILYNNIQKENQYCFRLSDTGGIVIDTLNLRYVWDFGDGKKTSGARVSHCWPGPGKYFVKLDVVDRSTGNLFFPKLSYNIDLKDIIQPFVNSADVAVKGDSLDLDANSSYLPGFRIVKYSWYFGDGTRGQGSKIKHSYIESGEFTVNLEVTIKSDLTGDVRKTGSSKKITIVNDKNSLISYKAKRSSLIASVPDIREYGKAGIKSVYSAEEEFKQDAVFQVELTSSKTKINLKSDIFRKVPKQYEIREIYNNNTGIYSYIVEQQMNLMDTYYAFKELEKAGYKDVQSKIMILRDPAEKDLYNLKKIFGTSTDSYFDSFGRLTSNAYLSLDQIVKIMDNYTGLKLEIDVHTDNTGLPDTKLSLSQKYAQGIIGYLTDRGIDGGRLVAKGFGGSKPIAPNILQGERNLNRRLDFVIIKE